MTPEPKRHAKFSASKMKTIINCPAMLGLAEKAPPLPEHPAAIEGTLTHECLEAYNTRQYAFRQVTKDLKRLGHPEDRIERAQKAYIRIQEIKKEYPGADFYAETEVNTSHFLEKGSFGTVDAAIAEPFGTLTIIDYKNGVMPVDAEENVQAICYALGFGKKYEYNFDHVDTIILQPNSRVQTRKESRWRASMKEIRSWIPIFKKAVAATKVENPKVNAGEWCYFCPAREFNCPAHKQKKTERAKTFWASNPEEMW